MINPYETPAAPAPEAGAAFSLHRPSRPEVAAALWFVIVAAVHFGMIAVPAFLLGKLTLDIILPVLWLAIAAGLYFRLAPVRRLVLLVGLFAIAGAVGGALALLLSLSVDSGVSADPGAAGGLPHKSQWQSCIALIAIFAYPVMVLWPRHVRDRFRDRPGGESGVNA